MDQSDLNRNRYMLKGRLAKKGYDWWWHSFTARHETTGQEQAFFIEYFFINPKISRDKIIFGMNKQQPSYAMMKVGAWGEDPRQVHNFYAHKQVTIDPNTLNISFGPCHLSEDHIQGACCVSQEEALSNPQWLSDPGDMVWDLKVSKKIAYNVGYGASRLFRALGAFEMFWHAEGIKTEYEGTVTWNGQVYKVSPETSYGYADKNWGQNFTSPWLWISTCNLWSHKHKKTLNHSALEIGGGQPKIFGLPIKKKLLMGLHYEGVDYDYNFSKFWKKSHIDFNFIEEGPDNIWKITATNKKSKIVLTIKCPQGEMLWIRYEAPSGRMDHKKLWNGGTGRGLLDLYHLKGSKEVHVDTIELSNVGCEYGEFDVF